MGDAEKNVEPVFGSGEQGQKDGGNWMPMAIGAVLVIVAVAVIVMATRGNRSGGPNQPDPYAAKLQISGLHMSTAENFAGGTVTYIEGKIANSGDKKVTGAQVELIFKNSLGEVSQKEHLPVMVVLPNIPYVDYGPLSRAPLPSGQERNFRLTVEHVTADWDGQLPQVRTISVSTS